MYVRGLIFVVVRFQISRLKNLYPAHKDPWIKLFEESYVYLEEDEVRKTVGTDMKIVFLIHTYGNDFVVMETDGLDGHKDLSRYRVLRQGLRKSHLSFGVKKHSFLLKPLTKFALVILQAGLMYRWAEDVFRRWPQYNTRHLLVERDMPTFSEPQGLSLYKVRPVIYFLLFGLGLSSIVFYVELFSSRSN